MAERRSARTIRHDDELAGSADGEFADHDTGLTGETQIEEDPWSAPCSREAETGRFAEAVSRLDIARERKACRAARRQPAEQRQAHHYGSAAGGSETNSASTSNPNASPLRGGAPGRS